VKQISDKRRAQLRAANLRYQLKHRPPKNRKFRKNGQPIDKQAMMSCLKVNETTQCWEWQRAKKAAGYGQLVDHLGNPKIAHRVAWELFVGPVPEGMCVLHHCDNPPCCNPEHLFLGTYQDNRRDCVNKRRHWQAVHPELIPRGEDNPNASLTTDQVKSIKRMHTDDGLSQREIGRRTGVDYRSVHKIINGKTWRHVC
jgi:hypothetical protein